MGPFLSQQGFIHRTPRGRLLTAAAFLSMIVPLVVFFSLQRYFVRGIVGGSVKG